ncbi:MAG: carboxypeptidase regulatory-like domain-containing protein [archaeon]|nr:carboxypeptidase regulatory-like domain-containing protein [archaeon]
MATGDTPVEKQTVNGIAEFTGLAAGSYLVSVTMDGYKTPDAVTITLTANQTEERTSTLNPSQANASASIEATVIDSATDAPLGAIVVVLKQGSRTINTSLTSSDGKKVFSGIVAGSYTITATALNYTAKTENVTIAVSDYGTTKPVEIKITPKPATLEVSVKTGSISVSGASVQLLKDGEAVGSPVLTDIIGKVKFSELAPGEYLIDITKSGYTYSSSSDNSDKRSVDLSAGVSGSKTVYLEKTTAGTFKAIVKNALNEPVEGATVNIYQGSVILKSSTTPSKTTDSRGIAEFSGLQPDNYTYEVSKAGYTKSSADTFSITGATVTKNISLQSTVTLIVTATEGSSPVSGAKITLNNSVSQKTTGSDGKAKFLGLVAGTYTISATKTGYEAESIPQFSIVTSDSGEINKGIEMNRQPGSLKVYVKEVSTAIAGAEVKVKNQNEVVCTKTTVAGIATCDSLVPGSYVIEVTKAGYVYSVVNESEIIRTVSVNSGRETTKTLLLVNSVESTENSETTSTDFKDMQKNETKTVTANCPEATIVDESASNCSESGSGILVGSGTLVPSVEENSFICSYTAPARCQDGLFGVLFACPTVTASASCVQAEYSE